MEAPRKIYLQLGESTESFNELGATWCSDRIDKTDIEYVIALPEISDEEIEKEFPYKHENGFIDYEFQGKRKAVKWAINRIQAKTKGNAEEGEKCNHAFKFHHGNTPIDDVYRCKKCGKIEYEKP